MRKAKTARVNANFSDEIIDQVYQKAMEHVQAKSYSFRHLVNLFYNASFLHKNTDIVTIELLKELKGQSKLLNPAAVMQVLQACSRPEKSIYGKEYVLVDYIVRNIFPMLQEISYDQKCLIFKYVAILELHLNLPRFRTPTILYPLRQSLKEGIDYLTEYDVTQVLEAYKILPKEFPNDLLEELKEMVIVTVQHNSSNIKSFFLLEFLEKATQLSRFRKIADDKIVIIYDEIAKRLPEDSHLSKLKSLEKLIEIYDKTEIKHKSLIEKVYQTVMGLQSPFFSGPILQCLANHGFDIVPILDKYLEIHDVTKIGTLNALRMFIVLSGLKVQKYQTLKVDLKNKLLSAHDEINKLINLISTSQIQNAEIGEVLDTMIQMLRNSKGKISDLVYYKAMFQSIVSKERRNEWHSWAKEHMANLEETELLKLVDALFSNEEFNLDQILLFTYILRINKPENIPVKRIIHGLKDSPQFFTEFAKAETKLEKFFDQLIGLMESNKEDVRLHAIFGIIRRLESSGLRYRSATNLLKEAYKISKGLEIHSGLSIEVVTTHYLLEEDALSVSDAKAFYDKYNRK